MATKRKSGRKAAPKRRSVPTVRPVSPCLWFDDEAEEAARHYVSVFRKARITAITRYPAVGQEVHQRPAGSVMTVEFVLNGVPFTALNGGPAFKFNEAVSLQVLCDTQEEIDHYWEGLGAGGNPDAQQCGWLKDRFGVSWQVVPARMARMMKDPKSPATERAFAAMMKMKKLDIAGLEKAYRGK
jgi:predicted 3-demethylubiquinone-9 3-methyltransferase (glyoxalase superfamily)